MMEERVSTWGNLGDSAFYCIDGGRIVAVLYWNPAAPGEMHEPGGEPVVMDAEWALVFADDPDNHIMLGLDDRDNEHAALDAAGRAVIDRAGGEG
jgi:hypothetical protein